MIESTKNKIKQLDISIQIISGYIDYIYDIVFFCSKIDPNTQNSHHNPNYTFNLPQFPVAELYNNIIEIYKPFNEIFLNPQKIQTSGEIEKKYFHEIQQHLYNDQNALIPFLEQATNTAILPFNQIQYFLNKLISLIESSKKLEKLYSLEIKQYENTFYKEQKELEFNTAYNFSANLQTISTELNTFNTFCKLEAKFYYIQEQILTIINQQRVTTQAQEITTYLEHINQLLKKSKTFHFGALIYIYALLQKEAQNTFIQKQIQEETLKNLIEFTNQKHNEKILETHEKKIDDYKQDKIQVKELNKVLHQAKDINTAINHMQTGQKLQLFFSAQQTQKEIKETKNIESTQQEPQKAKINTWFEYGKSDNYEKKLTGTSMGINIKELLKQNNIDTKLLDNYKKLD